MTKTKCDYCKKKKLVTMTCTCGKVLCLEHYCPESHECKRVLEKEYIPKSCELEATGVFAKVQKI